jgi:hypothetical protein
MTRSANPAAAYSYIRFSHPEQAKGDSLRRQGVEVAYLQTEPGEDIPEGASVIFRLRHLRHERRGRIGLAVVCPTETGLPRAAEHTCTSCGRCFGPKEGQQ